MTSETRTIWPSKVEVHLPFLKKAVVGVSTTPALLGVGYILGRRIGATLHERDYGSRVELANASVRLLREHPLIGTGPAYMSELGKLMGWGRVGSHNTYLQILLSFGILGALPFFIALVFTLKSAWNVRGSPWGGMWFAIVATALAFGVTGHLGYNKSFWLILALGGNAWVMAGMNPRSVLRFDGGHGRFRFPVRALLGASPRVQGRIGLK